MSDLHHSANNPRPTICPCCGAEFVGDLRSGCTRCGARSVGEPLAPPAEQLPRLGRASAAFGAGASLLGVMVAGTLVELVSGASARSGVSFGFWKVVAAAETIAWRAKWTLLPAAILSALIGVRYVLRVRPGAGDPPFGGRRLAKSGVLMSACAACLILLLISVTVPERLRQRELAKQAEINSLRHMTHAVLLRYQAQFGTLPTDFSDLRDLPDEDGTIAYVLANFTEGEYKPSSVQALAHAPKARGRKNAGVRVRMVAYQTNTNDAGVRAGGLTFTNYELIWAGEDKMLGTEDDRVIRDGEFVATSARHAPAPHTNTSPARATTTRRGAGG